MMKNFCCHLLLIPGITLAIITGCKKEPPNHNFELLTSTVWIKTEQCAAPVEDKSNYSVFKPDGEYYGEFYGFFSLPWSLKDNGKILVIEQAEYEIEVLTPTNLKLIGMCSMTFVAVPSAKVIAGGVSALSGSTADIHAIVLTNTSATVSFEYGLSASYGNIATPADYNLPDVSGTPVECILSGLSPGSVYHFRAKAINTDGTFFSNDMTFRTFNEQTVTDPDGNIYHTITIGTQTWMAENLKTTRFQNNDPIPNITESVQWAGTTTSAYCSYDNNSENGATYGRLYNMYAICDNRKLAPEGWHISTDSDWAILKGYLGEAIAGIKIKEYGTDHWISPNTGATNESGFTALPGGSRSSDGSFGAIRMAAWWWSINDNPDYISIQVMDFMSENVNWIDSPKTDGGIIAGFSVRCVKN